MDFIKTCVSSSCILLTILRILPQQNTALLSSVCRPSVCRHRRDISVFRLYNMSWTIQTIYFLKALGPRISKLILPSVSYSNTQIQIHIYTNTQIQHMTKCQKDPTCAIFLKIGLFKDIKNYISVCQTIQNTNTK